MTRIFFIYVTIALQMLMLIRKLNLPGKSVKCIIDSHVLLVYDYFHFFKNLKDNRMIDQNKELPFTQDGNICAIRWRKFEVLYKDRKNSIRLTKMTYTTVYLKPLFSRFSMIKLLLLFQLQRENLKLAKEQSIS